MVQRENKIYNKPNTIIIGRNLKKEIALHKAELATGKTKAPYLQKWCIY